MWVMKTAWVPPSTGARSAPGARARRTEYWMFVLFNFIISAGLGIVDTVVDPKARLLGGLYGLAVLVPGIAVGIRRLHDTNRSGWWLLIGLVPIIGAIVLIYFFVQDSQPGDNAYGPNPKGAAPVAA